MSNHEKMNLDRLSQITQNQLKQAIRQKGVLFNFKQKHSSVPLNHNLQMSSSGDLYSYSSSEAYGLLVTQIIFIIILFAMFVYWHYLNPNSLDVTRELQKDLLEASPIQEPAQ